MVWFQNGPNLQTPLLVRHPLLRDAKILLRVGGKSKQVPQDLFLLWRVSTVEWADLMHPWTPILSRSDPFHPFETAERTLQSGHAVTVSQHSLVH